MIVSLVIRVFVEGALHSETRVMIGPAQLEDVLPRLAEKHANLAAQRPTMIEIEFLDERDPNERFFRIGTDPRGMAEPVAISLERGER